MTFGHLERIKSILIHEHQQGSTRVNRNQHKPKTSPDDRKIE